MMSTSILKVVDQERGGHQRSLHTSCNLLLTVRGTISHSFKLDSSKKLLKTLQGRRSHLSTHQKMSRFMNMGTIFSKPLLECSPIEMIGIDANNIPHNKGAFMETDLLRRGMIRR